MDCIIEVVKGGRKQYYKNIINNQVNLVSEESQALKLPGSKADKVCDLVSAKVPTATVTVIVLENEDDNRV